MQQTNIATVPHPTFAEKARKKIQPLTTFNYPTEEQGIIFQHFEGAKIRDYLLAIYQLVGGASNIVAASRVSGGRVIVFLANKDLVENFQKKYGGFQFQNTFIKTRKLKAPSTKLIISNVSPTVPNVAIEDLLTKTLKLKLASPISILRVSPQDDLFPHVISSRRQVYVHSTEDLSHIPNLTQLTYADRTFTVFITLDDLTCFKCGSRGHKAENCIKLMDDEIDDIFDQNTPAFLNNERSKQEFPEITQGKVTLRPFTATENQPISSTTQPIKRGPSTLESSVISYDEEKVTETSQVNIAESNSQKPSMNKRQKVEKEQGKKPLNLTPDEITKITARLHHIHSTQIIDCDFTTADFLAFLPAVRGNLNKTEFAKALTSNVGNLLYILDEIKPDMEPGTKKNYFCTN